jgi:hypothetical protein
VPRGYAPQLHICSASAICKLHEPHSHTMRQLVISQQGLGEFTLQATEGFVRSLRDNLAHGGPRIARTCRYALTLLHCRYCAGFPWAMSRRAFVQRAV